MSKKETGPEATNQEVELTAKEQIQLWAEAGDSTKKIRAKLILADWTDKQISAAIADAGVGRITGKFTQVNTLKFMEDGVSEYDLYQKLIDEEAKNEARWINDRNKIRKTLNSIFAKFDQAVTEVEATKEQKELIKELVG